MGKVKKTYNRPRCRIAGIARPLLNAGSPEQEDYPPIKDSSKERNSFSDDESTGGTIWSILLPLLFMVSGFFSACHNETDVYLSGDPSGETGKTTVYLNLPDYNMEEAMEATDLSNPSRGVEYVIDNRIHPYWNDSVTIGVFPVAPQVNSQVKYTFTVPDKDASFRTQFAGVGWGLKANNTYAAYYPYRSLSSDLEFDSIPVNMTGQRQQGNGSMERFEQYEYLYAKATMPQDSSVAFNFDRKNAILWLTLVMPVEDAWQRVTITNTNGDSTFITQASMDVSTGTVKAVSTSNSISLELIDIVSHPGDTLNLFISALPTRTGPLMLSIESATVDKDLYAPLPDVTLKSNVVCHMTALPSADKRLYVDLGLPSGTIWANTNLGAMLPYETGQYYAWADVGNLPSFFYWTSYPYCKYYKEGDDFAYSGNSLSTLNKYTIPDEFYAGSWYDSNRNFIGDNLRRLLPEDDAAQYAWGGDWRVPTSQEFQELIDYCTATWTDNYENTGCGGYIFTAPNGASLFLPAAGWIGCESERDVDGFIHDSMNQEPGKPHIVFEPSNYFFRTHWEDAYGYNQSGYYWTSDLDPNYSFNALECKFTAFAARDSILHSRPDITDAKRYLGCSIRPVRTKK